MMKFISTQMQRLLFIFQNSASKIARRHACATKIRHVVERFALRFIGNQGMVAKAKTRQDAIHKKFGALIHTRRKTLGNAVRRLASLCNRTVEERDFNFMNAWLMLKDLDVVQPYSKTEKQKSGLEGAIRQLVTTNNVDEARALWDTQCLPREGTTESFWLSRCKRFQNGDLETINKLTRTLPEDMLLNQLEDDEFFQQEEEKEYVRDIIQAGRVFRNKNSSDLPQKYEECIWAVYNSNAPDIPKLKAKWNANNPDKLDRALLFDRNCWYLDDLYAYISGID